MQLQAFVYQDLANTGLATAPVPEPSTIALLAIGIAALGWFRLRRRRIG